jgi:hypothetical protein
MVSNTYYDELVRQCPPLSGFSTGDRNTGFSQRLDEAKRLTHFMQTVRPFCFLRMGDGELKHLLIYQSGRVDEFDKSQWDDGPVCGTRQSGNSGLSPKHAERLWRVYEQADYVDFHERNYPIEHIVNKLNLSRPATLHRNPNKICSMIFLTWVERELKAYCQGRRVGFVGAEAGLLDILSKADWFRQAAAAYWPDSPEDIFFHQPLDNGRNLDANLDLVKEDVKRFVLENQIDTIFISLGSGAKIIGYELSRELNICCFDFGAMMRALTYSGCDGNRAARSPHYPYLFRIPFGNYMDALETAMPNLSPEEILCKAHGQMLFEIVRREPGWTYAASEFDFCPENLASFRKAYRIYRRRYMKLFKHSPEAKLERAGFLHFCGTHGLTLEGRLFFALFEIKRRLAGLAGWARAILPKINATRLNS